MIQKSPKFKVEMGYKVPNKGIASDTCGNVSATKLRNTVNDSRIVTPEICKKIFKSNK